MKLIRGLDVHAIFFSKLKPHLTEILESLFFQRRIIISDDNVVLKQELMAHCRDAKTDKIVKKNDDTVDALRCLVYFIYRDELLGFEDEEQEQDTHEPLHENEWDWYPRQ